jgi:F-type H+-transporting ATPase subunit epsilon
VSAETTTGLLSLKVLTPEGSVLEGDVYEVTLPGSEGELGVLPAHAALLTKILPGALSYRAPEGQGTIALGRGVAEVREDRVTVLVERAVAAEDIDAAAVEARRKRLVAERDGSGITAERLEEIEEELVLIDVQLGVARPGAAQAAH